MSAGDDREKADDEKAIPMPPGWEDDYRLAYPKEYLGQPHLRVLAPQRSGHEIHVTIKRVEMPVLTMAKPGMRPRKRRNMVLHFAELEGRTDGIPGKWICGITSARVIGMLHGDAPRGWPGKRITLYCDPDVTYGKDKTGGLRVRPRVPPPATERSQRARGDVSKPPTTQESPPPAGSAPDLADQVRDLYRELENILKVPGLIPSARKRIEALPDDCADKPILLKSIARLERAANERTNDGKA